MNKERRQPMHVRQSHGGNRMVGQQPLTSPEASLVSVGEKVNYFQNVVLPLAESSASLDANTLGVLWSWAQCMEQILDGDPRLGPRLKVHLGLTDARRRGWAGHQLALHCLSNVMLSSGQCQAWILSSTQSGPERAERRALLRGRRVLKRTLLRAAYLHPQSRTKRAAQTILQEEHKPTNNALGRLYTWRKSSRKPDSEAAGTEEGVVALIGSLHTPEDVWHLGQILDAGREPELNTRLLHHLRRSHNDAEAQLVEKLILRSSTFRATWRGT